MPKPHPWPNSAFLPRQYQDDAFDELCVHQSPDGRTATHVFEPKASLLEVRKLYLPSIGSLHSRLCLGELKT